MQERRDEEIVPKYRHVPRIRRYSLFIMDESGSNL